MKKITAATCLLLLSACASNISGSVLPTTKDGRQKFTLSGVETYSSSETALETAKRKSTEELKLPCPDGIILTDDFQANVVPNLVGIRYVYWSGVVECKNKKIDWEFKK